LILDEEFDTIRIPTYMRLPGPFTPNLKVDVLQEISLAPKISPDFQCYIQPASFKKVI